MNLTDHMKLIDKSQTVVEINTNNNNDNWQISDGSWNEYK